jgi:hypothetical protein
MDVSYETLSAGVGFERDSASGCLFGITAFVRYFPAMRWLVILVLLAGTASADRDDVGVRELAAAKRAGLSCAKLRVLASRGAELERAPSLLAVAQQRCVRDGWKLEMIVCATRTQVMSWCDRRWLSEKQKLALDAALENAGKSRPNEKRQRYVNLALKNGILVDRKRPTPSVGSPWPRSMR